MIKKILKFVSAVMVFIFTFNCIQNILVGEYDGNKTTTRFNGFYNKTTENSLDAVLLGSSASYSFFIAPFVWHEYGITVYPLASPAQPIQAAQFLIEDARKTQPDALYIVNLSTIRSKFTTERFYHLFNDMPFSLNKIKAIDYIGDSYEKTLKEKLQILFPIVLFHERWSELNENDFKKVNDGYKSGNSYNAFLKKSVDIKSLGYVSDDVFAPLHDNINQSIIDLLDYCEEENVKVLFILTPQKVDTIELLGMMNTAKNMVEERGYPVLDMRADYKKLDLDYAVDYYNATHANMHGALKTSIYLADYLVNNYNFEDKKGNTEYEDWEDAYMRYYYECLEPNLIEADKKYFNAPLPNKADWEALQKSKK